jgi:hypothetical protein
MRMPEAGVFVKTVQDAIVRAKQCLLAAQDRMREQENRHRRDVTFEPNDMVMLSTTNMRFKGGCKKLMPKFVGPFEVVKMVGKAAVRLRLSEGYERMHNVFHVSKVKPYRSRPGQPPVQVHPLPLEWVDGEPVYEVEAILDHQCVPLKKGRGKGRVAVQGKQRITAYLVKWKGYGPEYNTWEPVGNVTGCDEILQTYRLSRGLSDELFVH